MLGNNKGFTEVKNVLDIDIHGIDIHIYGVGKANGFKLIDCIQIRDHTSGKVFRIGAEGNYLKIFEKDEPTLKGNKK